MRWALLLLVACGRLDFDPVAPPVHSSKRLKLVRNVFEDGTSQVETIEDTLRGERCDVWPTATGYACLPKSTHVVRYLDASCTQPVGRSDGGDDDKYVFESTYPPIAHVYALGDQVSPTTVYGRMYDGSCREFQDASTQTWRTVTEVPLDSFAALRRELEPGTQLRSQTYVTDDGFRAPGPLFDTAANASCSNFYFDDGVVCMPTLADLAQSYTDPDCSHVAVTSFIPIQFGIEVHKFPFCARSDVSVRPLGAELRGPPLYLRLIHDTICVGSGTSPGFRTFDLGEPLVLGSVERRPVPRPGARIELIITSDLSGAASMAGSELFDVQLDIECEIAVAADGVRRCLPATMSELRTDLFSDPSCTQTARIVKYGPTRCMSPLPPFHISETGSPSRGLTRVYQPGARYTSKLYFQAPMGCSLDTSDQEVYGVGPELDPSIFAAVTETIDP